MTDHVPDTHRPMPAEVPLALKSNLVLGPNTPKPPFSDASTAARGAKAERVLAALANTQDLRYFHDDGYPRKELQSDAAAALAVMQEMAAALARYAATDRDELHSRIVNLAAELARILRAAS